MNKVIQVYKELSYLDGNFYYYTQDNLLQFVWLYKGLYIDLRSSCVNSVSKDTIVERLRVVFGEDYRAYAEKMERPSMIDFFVFNTLGIDTSILNQNLEKYKDKELVAEKAKAEAAQIKAEAEKRDLIRLLDGFKHKNERLPISRLVDLCNLLHIKLHPRTKGMLLNYNRDYFNIYWDGKVLQGSFPAKMNRNTMQSIFDIGRRIISAA